MNQITNVSLRFLYSFYLSWSKNFTRLKIFKTSKFKVDVVTNSSSSEAGSDSEDEQAGPSDPPPLGMAPVTPERRKRLLERRKGSTSIVV